MAYGARSNVGYMVLYFASDEFKFVNGAVVRADNIMSVTCEFLH